MKYFKTVSALVFVLVVLVAVLLPLNREESIFELSLLVTPVLFTIFTAFSISERLSRVDKIRENDSIERSSLETLDAFVKANSMPDHPQVNTLIDNYLMATLDYSIWDYDKTRPYYENISEYLYSIKNDKVADFSVNILEKILEAREQTVTLISDRLSKMEWCVYWVLGIAVLVPYLMKNTGSLANVVFIILITAAIIILLLFLYKLDSLEWKKEVRIFGPYQKTFEAIGRLHYFPESLMSSKAVQQIAGNAYRAGHFPNLYPNMEGKIVKVYGTDKN